VHIDFDRSRIRLGGKMEFLQIAFVSVLSVVGAFIVLSFSTDEE
jgi:hypothetical protein